MGKSDFNIKQLHAKNEKKTHTVNSFNRRHRVKESTVGDYKCSFTICTDSIYSIRTYKSANNTQLAHTTLFVWILAEFLSGSDRLRLTATQWQAGLSFVCPSRGKGNQSLPTELLI